MYLDVIRNSSLKEWRLNRMDNLFNMKDKVVCIIGGTGLIGSALVDAFAKRGACVHVGTRFPKKHTSRKRRIAFIEVDIRYTKSIKNFIHTVTRGGKKIDVWVNCAFPRHQGCVGTIEKARYEFVSDELNSHLMGFYRCCCEVLMYMKKSKHGVIINLGSIYGDLSPDFRIYKDTEIPIMPAYPMIKGGIHAFTKYLACYAAPFNIRVNAVCPGGVLNKHSVLFQKQYSNRIPMRRMAHAEEIVGPVIFLASAASSYITGHLLYVDGGLHAW